VKADDVADAGGAIGANPGPGACLYDPYVHGRFPSHEAAGNAAAAFDRSCDEQTIGNFVISTGRVGLSIPKPSTSKSGHRNEPFRRARGEITSWSPKSRFAMARRFASLDYSPWNQLADNGFRVVMLTLTYPGNWLEIVPGSSVATRHLRVFRERLHRATGQPPHVIWKREFQRRGAPHYHLLLPLPLSIGPETIQEWVSRSWFEIVGSGDPRHLAAGTGLDWTEGLRMVDPVRLARYFSSHAAPNGRSTKEYQNIAEKAWIDAHDVGRFWGYWNLKNIQESVPLDEHQVIEVRRILRGLDRSRRRTRIHRVTRVDRATGVIRYRRVRRRAVLKHLASGRLVGASVFTIDGPAVAQILARFFRVEAAVDQADPQQKNKP
jgi:hypothetical protein